MMLRLSMFLRRFERCVTIGKVSDRVSSFFSLGGNMDTQAEEDDDDEQPTGVAPAGRVLGLDASGRVEAAAHAVSTTRDNA